MSLFANIEHLAAAPGVVAVTIDSPNHPRAFRGVESWAPVTAAALQLFAQTGEDTIRLVIGQHTLIIQKEHGDTVAVVLPTGHAIAKSLRRMIRRLAKKERGPVVPPARTPQVPAAAAPDDDDLQGSPANPGNAHPEAA